jgi:molybdopterin converting factor small subunit
MRVTVEFLSLPIVTKAVGAKQISVDLAGRTVHDLVEELGRRYGPRVRDFLLDDEGRLDLPFRVQLNRAEWLYRDDLHHVLANGDHVAIMMLVGGG